MMVGGLVCGCERLWVMGCGYYCGYCHCGGALVASETYSYLAAAATHRANPTNHKRPEEILSMFTVCMYMR